MGFVRTPEEMEIIKSLALRPLHLIYYDRLTAVFETDPDFVRHVLPPCFEPAPQATACATVSSWKVPREKFMVATLNVRAVFEGEEGWYDIIHLISTDMASYFGRDMYGECKKVGTMDIRADGQKVFATGDRFGHRLIEIDAEFGEDLGPEEIEGKCFGLKGHIATDRYSLDADPEVHVIRLTEKRASYRKGQGTVKLPGSEIDPTHTVPVGNMIEMGRASGTYYMAPERSVTIEGQRDVYAPYVFGRFYDFALPAKDQVSTILKEYELDA